MSALLRYQRESLVRNVTGLDDDAARRAIVGSGTTLLGLTKHLTRAEELGVLRRFAGEHVEILDDTVHPDDSSAGAVHAYRDAKSGLTPWLTRRALDEPLS